MAEVSQGRSTTCGIGDGTLSDIGLNRSSIRSAPLGALIR
jgi:hypothetical protein